MVRRLMVIATVALLAAPAAAHAKCMAPRAFLSPGSGTVLPPNPVLYLFVPGRVSNTPPAVDLAVDGSAVASQVESVGSVRAFATYRVTIARETPGTLDVKVTLADAFASVLEARYTIGEAAPAASASARGTGQPRHRSSSFVCSHHDTWDVPLGVDAPAYRVEWAYSREGYDTGPRVSAVFPRSLGSFFESSEGEPLLQLGAVSCFGTTFHWPLTPIRLGIWALRADGTEVPLTSDPLILLKP